MKIRIELEVLREDTKPTTAEMKEHIIRELQNGMEDYLLESFTDEDGDGDEIEFDINDVTVTEVNDLPPRTRH